LKRTRKRELLLPDCLSWDMVLYLVYRFRLKSQIFSRLELIPSALLVLRLFDSDWNYTLSLLGLQLAHCRQSLL
jgi:hypothetical protein